MIKDIFRERFEKGDVFLHGQRSYGGKSDVSLFVIHEFLAEGTMLRLWDVPKSDNFDVRGYYLWGDMYTDDLQSQVVQPETNFSVLTIRNVTVRKVNLQEILFNPKILDSYKECLTKLVNDIKAGKKIKK